MSMRFIAVLASGLWGLALLQPVAAQDQQLTPDKAPSERIAEALQQEFDPEELKLARRVVDVTDVTRPFDSILPEVADKAKTTLIRSNPQMQLGIIEVVDRVALEMVDQRAELEEIVAKIWASAFTAEELQTLLDFYQTPVGEKYANVFPGILRAQIGAAEWWGQRLSQTLFARVQQELQRMAEAEGQRLQDAAPPQPEVPSVPGAATSGQ